MPKLWEETIEAHRREVYRAILDTAAALVAEHGLLSVTMSRIAAEAGIGRATLYKYFPDVEAVLLAWHERQVAGHLDELAELAGRADEPGVRLGAVLEAYATRAARGHHDTGLAALLHRDEHLGDAHQRLHVIIRDLLGEAAGAGAVRDDVAPEELARYCVHALAAAGTMPSAAAVHRLVVVTLAGLRPVTGDEARRRGAGLP